MNELQRMCHIIRFKKPKKTEFVAFIKHIVSKTKMKISNDTINYITQFCNYDYRRLLNILQFIYYSHNNRCKVSIKIKDINIFSNSTGNNELFKSTTHLLYDNNISIDKTITYYNAEKVLLPLMIHQNYIPVLFSKYSKNRKNLFLVIKKISQHISFNDLISYHIYNSYNWGIQPLHSILLCYYPTYLMRQLEQNKNIVKFKIKFTSILSKTSIHHVNCNQYNYICRTIKNYNNYYDSENIKFLCKKILVFLFSDNVDTQYEGIRLLKYYGLNVTDTTKLIKFANIYELEDKFTKKISHQFKKISDRITISETQSTRSLHFH